MRTYENKDELKNEINKSFAKYISEFDIIPESLKDKRVEEVDRTPAENLAYQVGWTTLPANVFTYTFGIITALVAGVGMCLSMKVIGNGSTAMFVLGVIVGIIGLLGMGVNYPIYKKLLAQGKQKYAFEIMELAKEISEK